MINFEDELEKFKPVLEVADVTNAVKNSDSDDVYSLLQSFKRSWEGNQ